MHRLAHQFHRRSVVLVERLGRSRRQLILIWAIAAGVGCAIRLAIGPFATLPPAAQIVAALPYLLIVGTPVAAALLAWRWFRRGERMEQPRFRLARAGRWRAVAPAEARVHPLYGVAGLMASVLVGMLIHIPVRTVEFLAAMPVPGATPPEWFGSLYALMLADNVLLCSLYAIAFVAALRRVPLFPRLLATIWLLDATMQLVIADVMGGINDLPPAVADALATLLRGNLQQVLISVSLWGPYLLLSKRVNVTFRHRLPI